ncbi:MAG TPA: hypothetical protein VHW65_10070 [Gemmatimonadales bacterium]|jgi:hypothetical protein|nr:hypothetical protein [Gemmatimonadales bacterium]
MADGVPVLLPLSLLEAVQNIDTPPDDGLGALEQELAAKRLGLSPTVAAQVARYRGMLGSGGEVADEEAVAIFRLVGRRPDAGLVYADGGRRAARYAGKRLSVGSRGLIAAAPGRAGTVLGLRAAGRLARRWLLADLRESERGARCEMSDSIALRGREDGTGCQFYHAAIGELLRVVAGLEWAVTHTACRGRGDATCVWHAAASGNYE